MCTKEHICIAKDMTCTVSLSLEYEYDSDCGDDENAYDEYDAYEQGCAELSKVYMV